MALPFLFDYLSADLDGDGDLDLAVLLYTSNGISLIENQGSGQLKEHGKIEVPSELFAMAVADLDGDRRPDLVTGGLTDQFVSLYVEDLLVRDYSGNRIFFLANDTRPPRSEDRNHDGIPDECQTSPFHRGDSNGDGRVDISDGLCVLRSLFLGAGCLAPRGGGAAVGCLEAADAKNDGKVDCTDPVVILGWLFLGTAAPPAPGPPPDPCGRDTDAPGTPGDLGCEAYPAC